MANKLEFQSDLQLMEQEGAYDAACKRVLMHKEVLAFILKYVVSEYKDYSLEQIIEYIEKNSITDKAEVSGERTNFVSGDNTNFASITEKTVNFDILFKAINPQPSKEHVTVKLHIDIESQKNYYPSYSIEKRGVYYLAREISSQLGVITKNTDYNCLEKVYSIWICFQAPKEYQNGISYFKFENYKNEGKIRKKAAQEADLMELVVICFGDMEEETKYEIIEFLRSVFYYKLDGIQKYIDIKENQELRKDVEDMLGVGDIVFNQGVRQGIEEGIVQGIEQGIVQGIEQGEEKLIYQMLSIGRSPEEIASFCNISIEEVLKVVKKHQ